MLGVLQGAPTYLVHQELSQGGMGAVHLGTVVSSAGERRVAIKRLLLAKQAGADEHGRVIAEAQLVFQLTHANICQVLDLVESDDGTFIVMEYVDGCDLGSLLATLSKRERSLEPPAAVYIAREIARALDYAHRRVDGKGQALQLVHGDVKPANILLSREGEVKLADFGIARAFGIHAPGNRVTGGTPGYMAPEQEQGPVDQRADVYSLGVTLYAALGGAVAQGRIDLHALQGVSPELVAILERATARRPEDRYQTVAELERALHKFPSFSPQLLGEQVREVARSHTPSDKMATRTLFSLTASNAAGPRSEDSPAPILKRTQKASAKRSRFKLLPFGAIGIAAIAAVLFAARPHLQQPARAKEPPPAVPAVAVPVIPPQPAPALLVSPRPASRLSSPVGSKRAAAKAHLPRAAETAGQGYLSVESDPWGVVYVDGKEIAKQTPAYRVPISAGPHRVTVFNPQRGRASPARSVNIRSGENAVVGFEW